MRKLELTVRANTDGETIAKHVRSALARGLPDCRLGEHAGPAILAAAGPSLLSSIETIRGLDLPVYAVKGAARVLHDAGIPVAGCILMDAAREQRGYVRDPVPCPYLVASQSHPAVFDALKDCDVSVWTAYSSTANLPSGITAIQGGCTVGARSISLLAYRGHDLIHLFGYDSCVVDGALHAYRAVTPQRDRIDVTCAGRSFVTTRVLAAQFDDTLKLLVHPWCPQLVVHGDGLVAHAARVLGHPRLSTP